MPLVPVCLLKPLWAKFATLLPGGRPSPPPIRWAATAAASRDRVVFEHLIAALVHGSGYERIASPGCSDATIRRGCRSGPGPA